MLWPSVPLVVEKRLTGLAYGVCTSVQNLGLALFPLIVAQIYQIHDKYCPDVEMFFVALACLGSVVGFYMNYYDHTHDNVFNKVYTLDLKDDDEFDTLSGRDSQQRSFKGSFSQAEAADRIRQISRG